ncbi:unnamed protein product [Ilex paraguariensis]|uniref:Uncharacterized protein n=1 Tax=Ilex paraguariensis TaxID=185542 RepID=A0ABC8RGK7_9AQUA
MHRSLRLQKKTLDRTISELEQKAAEEAVGNELLEKLGDLVTEREGIQRKLSTSYSLGRDRAASSNSLLPLYDGKTRSYSFQGSKKESVTIFRTLSDTSSADSSSEEEANTNIYKDKESAIKAKGKAHIEMGNSSNGKNYEIHYRATPSGSGSGSKGFINPLFMEQASDETGKVKFQDEGEVMETMQNGSRSIRKRASSSTN